MAKLSKTAAKYVQCIEAKMELQRKGGFSWEFPEIHKQLSAAREEWLVVFKRASEADRAAVDKAMLSWHDLNDSMYGKWQPPVA